MRAGVVLAALVLTGCVSGPTDHDRWQLHYATEQEHRDCKAAVNENYPRDGTHERSEERLREFMACNQLLIGASPPLHGDPAQFILPGSLPISVTPFHPVPTPYVVR